MNKEPEELQFLGVIGIYQEAYKILVSWRKLFTQITLILIVPLSFIFLVHIQVSHLLFTNIDRHADDLENPTLPIHTRHQILQKISSEFSVFYLFNVAYVIFLFIFSLLSTSAVVYAIACIYTAKEVTFRKVIISLPKVWKRVMVTFLWSFIFIFAYNAGAILTFIFFLLLIPPSPLGSLVIIIILIVYVIGLVYIGVVWQLASVVSVLEEDRYGMKAMKKSKELIKGKTGTGSLIFIMLHLAFMAIQNFFGKVVFDEGPLGLAGRLWLGFLLFFLLTFFYLLSLIVQTVLYFVCKSYHHENVDKPSLSDHLEVYLGDYVPLKARSIQLEQVHV